MVECDSSMGKLGKWSKGEDDEGLKEVFSRALEKLNKKEAESWMESMKQLEKVAYETYLKVKDGREGLKKEKACPAMEDFEEMDKVKNLLISEAVKAMKALQ